MKEVTRPIACPDHQCGPVTVAVKYKLYTTFPLMVHRPHHGCAVLLIKYITLNKSIIEINCVLIIFVIQNFIFEYLVFQNYHHCCSKGKITINRKRIKK